MKKRFGNYLRQERKGRGLSLRRLAAQSGLPLSTVASVERGVSEPQLSTLCKISHGLGLSFKEMAAAFEELCGRMHRL
jgi:transcriptional regulator with XRE-family HTH domain